MSSSRVADLLGRLEDPAAAEDAEPDEQALFLVVEQLVAPLDRRPQRLLALGQVAPAGGEERQPVLQPAEQLVRLEHLHPGGRQLDRERQAVEAAADLGQPAVVAAEARQHGLRPLPEELDRRRLRERRERELALARDPERLAARGEDAQVRAPALQAGELAGAAPTTCSRLSSDEQELAVSRRAPPRSPSAVQRLARSSAARGPDP